MPCKIADIRGMAFMRRLCEELSQSSREAGRIGRAEAKPSRVFAYDAIDIRKLGKSLDVSQADFAHMIGGSKGTLQNREQGRRHPRGPARALLRVFENRRASSALWAEPENRVCPLALP